MGINYKSSWTDVRDAVPNDARNVFVLLRHGFLGTARLVKESPSVWKGCSGAVTHWTDALAGVSHPKRGWRIQNSELPDLLDGDLVNLPPCYSVVYSEPPYHYWTLRFDELVYSLLRKVA